MTNRKSLGERDLERLFLFIYLIPVVGFFPSLWTLYLQQGSREQQKLSRLAVTLALGWLVSYFLLAFGAQQTTNLLTLRLSLINALLTSGYFLVCIMLMVRLWQQKRPHLPFISKVAEGVVKKYLSS